LGKRGNAPSAANYKFVAPRKLDPNDYDKGNENHNKRRSIYAASSATAKPPDNNNKRRRDNRETAATSEAAPDALPAAPQPDFPPRSAPATRTSPNAAAPAEVKLKNANRLRTAVGVFYVRARHGKQKRFERIFPSSKIPT